MVKCRKQHTAESCELALEYVVLRNAAATLLGNSVASALSNVTVSSMNKEIRRWNFGRALDSMDVH